MTVLIPSYEPDRRLVDLVLALAGQRVVVVDDGSGPAYAEFFAAARALGAEVLTHEVNRGKGAALRTGFAHLAREGADGEAVICADSDGQHTPADIAAVAAQVAVSGADMVLGVRAFTGHVPWRSRFGNDLTARLFGALTGLRIGDTQTGLRGYPARMLPWLLAVRGDGFDYELKLLLRAARERLDVRQLPIETIYLEENASSHFRPVRDSVRIYLPFLAFGAASFVGFVVDVAALALFLGLGLGLVGAAVAARVISGATNFSLNRRWAFREREAPLRYAALRYAALAAVLLAANVVLLDALVGAGLAVAWAKLLTEAVLLCASYAAQRLLVFALPRARVAPTREGNAPSRLG